jgi:hypothetical protein
MNHVIDRKVTQVRKLQHRHKIPLTRWARYSDAHWLMILSQLSLVTPKSARQIQKELHDIGYYELQISTIRNMLYLLSRDILNSTQFQLMWFCVYKVVVSQESSGVNLYSCERRK